MKKTNGLKKGFTLIELIVVIAIIAVLAAVLVPNMIGYVKNSKISTANQSAKTIHTAASAWIIDANINGYPAVSATGTGTYYATANINDTDLSVGATDAAGTAVPMDLSDELGDEFKGWFGVHINEASTGVDFVLYCATATPKSATIAGTSIADSRGQWTAKEQKDNDGKDIVGCYPLK